MDVILGMRLDLPCRAVGNPPPVISWHKDGFHVITGGEYILEQDGTLRISESKLTHAGKYTCSARNTAGAVERMTELIVQEPPRIDASVSNSYTVIEGQRIELKCAASGFPIPEIKWFRHGSTLRNQDGVRIYPDGKLIIENAKDKHHGLYVCRAINKAGEATVDFMVTVISKCIFSFSVITPFYLLIYSAAPIIPDQGVVVTEEVLLGTPFTLYCPVSSTPIPEVSIFCTKFRN